MTNIQKRIVVEELRGLMKRAQAGDIILVSEISRLSRSMVDMYEIAKYLTDKKVMVYCVKENLEIGTSALGLMIMTVFAFAAQIERERISERTKEALARKREQGVVLGRPKGRRSTHYKLDTRKAEILKWLDKGIAKRKIARKLKTSTTTINKMLTIWNGGSEL